MTDLIAAAIICAALFIHWRKIMSDIPSMLADAIKPLVDETNRLTASFLALNEALPAIVAKAKEAGMEEDREAVIEHVRNVQDIARGIGVKADLIDQFITEHAPLSMPSAKSGGTTKPEGGGG